MPTTTAASLPCPQPNSDLTSASAFRLRHARPGTLSLSLSECDEDPELRTGNPAYRPTEFLITTGECPGVGDQLAISCWGCGVNEFQLAEFLITTGEGGGSLEGCVARSLRGAAKGMSRWQLQLRPPAHAVPHHHE